MTVAHVSRDALSLDVKSQALIAKILLASIDEGREDTIQTVWTSELEERQHLADSGAVKMLDHDEAMSDLRARFA